MTQLAERRPPSPYVTPAPSIETLLAVRAGVPPRFRDCRLETFQARQGTRSALAAAKRLAAEPELERGLVLSGPPGTGKTHLAVGILAARYEAWTQAYPDPVTYTDAGVITRPSCDLGFVVVPTLLDRLRMGVQYVDAADPLPDLIRADLLVLDDLGREKSTDWALERLYVLVNERYNHRRPTIVTTNYPPAELIERGYDALVSRLVDAADVVRITAADYRSSPS